MSRDNEHLIDLVESARPALAYVQDKTRGDFEDDIQCQDAVFRRPEIIGEAARRLSTETQEAYPQLL